ncbi:MAG: PAS domain-containing protein [Zoogloeaceae bacterium]|nr:PAS domain-containing protein [Zoogloeaceae bacterium]
MTQEPDSGPAPEGRDALPGLPASALEHPPEGVGEDVWIDVIRKMDEVYSDLLQYEVALEEKNAKLEETQKFIFSVLTSMSDVLVVCDRHGIIQEANQALAELVGNSEEALRGTPLVDLFADEASREQARRFLHDLHSERIQDCELHFRCRYATEMPVAVNCTPRLSPVGKFAGMVMTGRPVGDLRRAYEQLRHAHEDLKLAQQQLVHSEKMASLGRLVAGVAHELNNPISFVLGNVYALQRYGNRMQEYLAAIHAGKPAADIAGLRQTLRIDRLMEDMKPLIDGTIEGAERTHDIVAGLRRFSTQDRGDEEVFNLAEVLERSVRWVVRASGAKVDVRIDAPEAIPVSGSAGQMQQVLVNLAQNAIDSTERQADARLDIRAKLGNQSVTLTFHDSGPGLRDEVISRIFDPFFTTKPVGKGTGLGLSISYGIVERHHGQLKAANHPEGGAVLTLTLPLAG